MGRKKKEVQEEVTFQELVAKIVKHYGGTTTKIIAIEEFGELSKEITKDLRGKFRKDFFMEEMADVYICMEALMQVYGVDMQEFEDYLVDKMSRNLNRIKNDVELGEVMKDVVAKGGGTIL